MSEDVSSAADVSYDPLAAFDGPGLDELVATVAGLRQQFVNDGWSQEQAQDIIAGLYRQIGRPASDDDA